MLYRLILLMLAALPPSGANAQPVAMTGRWHVGVEFGEIPFHGSFKPGLAVGYHFNDLVYAGVVYQLRDAIRRDGTSFNAKAVSLDGLVGSSERVGQRAYVQLRLRPHRLAPYASVGFVFNDRDTETIRFDDRSRTISAEQVEGALRVTQSRAPGLRPALGLGYGYTFASGLTLFTEWAGWWLFGAPAPTVNIEGDHITRAAEGRLRGRIVDAFTSSPFNTYHVFQIGVGYIW